MGEATSVTVRNGVETVAKDMGAGEDRPPVGKYVPLPSGQDAHSTRITVNRGEASKVQGDRHAHVKIDSDGLNGLASARTEGDIPIHDLRNITSKSSVSFEGRRMLVSTAVQLGYLTQVGGQYVEANPNAISDAQKQAQDNPDTANTEVVDFTSDHGNSQLQALAQASSPSYVQSTMTAILGQMADGSDCSGLMADFAQITGADLASLTEVVEETFNTQLERACAFCERTEGINADKMIEYVMNSSAGFKKTCLLAIYNNDVNFMKQLAKAYHSKRTL